MNRLLIFFISFSFLFPQFNDNSLIQKRNFPGFGEDYDCSGVKIGDDQYSILYTFNETFIRGIDYMTEIVKDEQQTRTDRNKNICLSNKETAKKLLSIIEEYDYWAKSSKRKGSTLFNEEIYYEERIYMAQILLEFYLDVGSFHCNYQSKNPRKITDFDKKIIALGEKVFFDLEKNNSVYLFENKNKHFTPTFRVLLEISSYLAEFYRFTEFHYSYNKTGADDRAYYWFKKRFEIYQRINSHLEKSLIIDSISFINSDSDEIQSPCSPSSVVFDELLGPSEDSEDLYPVGKFELDYLEFIEEFFYYDINHQFLYMEEIIKSFDQISFDLEKLLYEGDIFASQAKHTFVFAHYKAAKSSIEQLYQIYLLNLNILDTYSNVTLLKQLDESFSNITNNLIDKMSNDILGKIDEDILFQLAEEDPTYGLEYIIYKLEMFRNEEHMMEVPKESIIKFYAKKLDILERKLNELGSSSLDRSYLKTAKNKLNKFEGDGDFIEQIVSLYGKIGDNQLNNRKIKKELRNIAKKINLDSFSNAENFQLIGLLGAFDSEDSDFLNIFLEGLDETRESISLKMKHFMDKVIKEMELDSIYLSEFSEIYLLYFSFLESMLGINSELFFLEFVEKSDIIFSSLTIDDVQKNILLFNNVSSYAKQLLEIDRILSIDNFDHEGAKRYWQEQGKNNNEGTNIGILNYFSHLQYINLIDKIRDLPTERNTSQTLDQYFFGVSVKRLFGVRTGEEYNPFTSNKILSDKIFDKIKDGEVLILYDSIVGNRLLNFSNVPDLRVTVWKKNGTTMSYDSYIRQSIDEESVQSSVNNKKLFLKFNENNVPIDQIDSLSESLYELLIGVNSGLEDYISDSKYLTIVSDPIYSNNIPFEVFVPNSSSNNFTNEPLLYQFESINYANSLSDYVNTKSKRFNASINTSAGIFGNINYENNEINDEKYRNLGNIPWTKNELNYISNMFWRSIIFDNKDATETNFKSRTNNINLIHLALHGLNIEEDYKESALIFRSDSQNDGILKFDEIANLDLNHINLIVLSACNTNKGESYAGFGNTSLQKAFKLSGVDNIISTLWAIDDKASYYFMREYYIALKNYQNSAVALTFAKRSFIKEYPQYAHPHYWAAFVHYGSY